MYAMGLLKTSLVLPPFQGLSASLLSPQGLRPFDKLRAGPGLHSIAALRLLKWTLRVW